MSGRSRRTRTHGPSGIPSVAEPPPDEVSVGGEAASEGQLPPDEASEAVQAVAPAPTPTPVYRSRGRGLQSRPIEAYFRKEMLHIGVASAVVFAVLAVLSVVLS